MQFTYPVYLYALFALVVPIIVHFFEFRKFKIIPFTNVNFLKEIEIKNRRSAKLKKWLLLFVRLLTYSMLIIAFAKPYFENKTGKDTNEIVIYLDNSFSMQLRGDKGPLLQTAITNLLNDLETDKSISLFTNNDIFKNISTSDLKSKLTNLGYSNNHLTLSAQVFRGNSLFSNPKSTSNKLILISDFQKYEETETDSYNIADKNIQAVQLKPIDKENVSLHSVQIVDRTASFIKFEISARGISDSTATVPLSLFHENGTLIAKSSLKATNNSKTTVSVAADIPLDLAYFSISDYGMDYDNRLFISLNPNKVINILSINTSEDLFLKKIFSSSEFNFKSVSPENVDQANINLNHLIVLNEITNIPELLLQSLNSFVNNGGHILIIPSEKAPAEVINPLLPESLQIDTTLQQKRLVSYISENADLYKGVFNNKIDKFQYPFVKSFSVYKNNPTALLTLDNNAPFLTYEGRVYMFASALNKTNSNFTSAPLIVPTIYNIAKLSQPKQKLYYDIGVKNYIDISTDHRDESAVKISNTQFSNIPLQQKFYNSTRLTTSGEPSISGGYQLTKGKDSLGTISFNYQRNESNLNYYNVNDLNIFSHNYNLSETLKNLKSSSKANDLWKWFVTFAVILIGFEILILKFFK